MMNKTKKIWIPGKEIKLDENDLSDIPDIEPEDTIKSITSANIDPNDLKSIVFTKVGDHGDEPLWRILERKKKEDETYRQFWWGFTKLKIKPEIVQEFVKESKGKVWLVMALVKNIENQKEFHRNPFMEYSDYYKRGKGSHWAEYYKEKTDVDKDLTEICKEYIVGVGDNGKGCALIAHNLKRVNFSIDLCSYKVYDGDSLCEDRYKNLNDTHCATLIMNKKSCHIHPKEREKRKIYFTAKLLEPYCVYTYEKLQK